MPAAIQINGLSKVFRSGAIWMRSLVALQNLDLEVRSGEVFGLLGPNGSGKSTTIKICLDLVRPTKGYSRIFGEKTSVPGTRQRVGYVPEAPFFYGYLKGRELVDSMGRFSGLRGADLARRRDQVLELVELTDSAERPIRNYSKGMLQRLGIAQALVHDPDLIILDEPTAGVDPIGSHQISDLIRLLKSQGKTILLCSHLLSQVESVCDRVAILHRGEKLAEGTLEDLVQTAAENRSLRFQNAEVCSRAEQVLQREGIAFTRESPEGASLEDVFISLVQSKTPSSS